MEWPRWRREMLNETTDVSGEPWKICLLTWLTLYWIVSLCTLTSLSLFISLCWQVIGASRPRGLTIWSISWCLCFVFRHILYTVCTHKRTLQFHSIYIDTIIIAPVKIFKQLRTFDFGLLVPIITWNFKICPFVIISWIIYKALE